MEFIETVFQLSAENARPMIHVITRPAENQPDACIEDDSQIKQEQDFHEMQRELEKHGVKFTWEFDPTLHIREIELDNGWTINSDRGLDIFKYYEWNNSFVLDNRVQEARTCHSFKVVAVKSRS